jgi:hypothetical protein
MRWPGGIQLEKHNRWSRTHEHGMHLVCENGMSVNVAANLTEDQRLYHMRNNESDRSGDSASLADGIRRGESRASVCGSISAFCWYPHF